MPDREKVISEFSECVQRGGWTHCGYCEYKNANSLLTCEPLAKEILALLKEQEAVVPVCEQDSMVCGNCGHEVIWQRLLGDGVWLDEQLDYCPKCGWAVKWDA